MENIFDKFNDMVDVEALSKEVEETSADGDRDFVEVPHGEYEVRIVKLQLVETKKEPKRPMVTVWFRVVAGEYEGETIFMNQVVTHPYALKVALDFVNSLLMDGDVKEVDFKNGVVYDEAIMFTPEGGYFQLFEDLISVAEFIEDKYEYGLAYREGKKGFDTYEITSIFDA